MLLKLSAPFLLLAFLAIASAGLVGGPVTANMNDPDVRQALDFGIDQYNKMTNDAYQCRVSQVLSVQKQVVAGLKYIFNVQLARTSCRKNDNSCDPGTDPNASQVQTCTFSVWSRPWLNNMKFMDNNCL